jgi:hypothetical protein
MGEADMSAAEFFERNGVNSVIGQAAAVAGNYNLPDNWLQMHNIPPSSIRKPLPMDATRIEIPLSPTLTVETVDGGQTVSLVSTGLQPATIQLTMADIKKISDLIGVALEMKMRMEERQKAEEL